MKPSLFVYVNAETGLATVRGRDAKAFCQAAEPTSGRRWRTVWSGGWCVPVTALADLRAFARAAGRAIAVSSNPAPSRDKSRDTSRAGRGDGPAEQIPGQETLL